MANGNRQCSCSYFSALIVLLANLSIHPSHALVSLDQHLAAKALYLFDKLLEVVENKAFQTLRGIIGELYNAANAAVEAERMEQNAEGNDVFGGMNAEVDVTHAVGTLDFLPLENDVDVLGGTFGSVDGLGEFESSFEGLNGGSALEEMQAMNFSQFMG